jgi:predicted flavoprotein YhiN
MEKKKIVVIGGGAAGFFSAIQIAELHPDWEISILEKSSKILSKVKVSGGGRCNVTHACPDIEILLKKYPRGARFLKKAFYQFATKNTIAWFAKNGVTLHTEKDGRMFPTTNNSETIIECLLSKVKEYKIQVLLNHEVVDIVKQKSNVHHGDTDTANANANANATNTTIDATKNFTITLSNNIIINADAICMATGGMLKVNSFEWLTRLGHSIVEPVPSLFTFNTSDKSITSLMGVAVDNASIQWAGNKHIEKGPLLITHWGISGPAAIKLSAWCAREMAAVNYDGQIIINWVPTYTEQSLKMEWINFRLDFGKREMGSKNPFNLPNRLWHYFLQAAEINTSLKWADLKSTQQQILIQHLVRTTLPIKGKTTFKEEFVTCGGVELNEIEASTMESKLVPGLHFAGEMMDVDGITGGFNFQHAWTSGWIAAQHMGQLH